MTDSLKPSNQCTLERFLEIKFEGEGIKLITLRPNSFAAEEVGGDAAAAQLTVEAKEERIKLIELKKGESEKIDLTEYHELYLVDVLLVQKKSFLFLKNARK